jgi:hypothetical protein
VTKSLSSVRPIVEQLAKRPEGFSNGDLAKALGITPKLTGYWLKMCLNTGHIFLGKPEGKFGRYFHSPARAQAFAQGHQEPQFAQGSVSHEAVAKDAVERLRGHTLGSSALAELCRVDPTTIDAALAPLVNARKLVRITAFRNGAAEYDYRWSSTWIPDEADFQLCRGGGTVRPASISPVAPPAPGRLEAGRPPASLPAQVTRPVAREERVATGKSGGHSKAAKDSLDRAFAQSPQSLGWAAAPASRETKAAGAETNPSVRETKGAPAEARIHIKVEPVPLQIDVSDLVCALNSRGELALDVGDEVLIKFKPKQALVLTRFLAGTTVLEQMAQRGELS